MIKRYCLVMMSLMLSMIVMAESWDEVVNSGEYYYGIGIAETQEEASEAALANMMESIVVHVSSDFEMLSEENTVNGSLDSKTKVRNCLNSYSQGSFTNVRSMMQKDKDKKIQVLRYMHRSELSAIYQRRIESALNWMRIAEQSLENKKIDMALQYYYWAYALVRSLQHPYEAKDNQGNVLVTTLPVRIREILGKIDVKYENQDGEFVNLLFAYEGSPVTCVDFSYNDGQAKCEDCSARDGRGCMEMAKGYEDNDVFHVFIEYEYKSQARGDSELQSVLNVVPKAVFAEATHLVKRNTNVVEKNRAKSKSQIVDHSSVKQQSAGVPTALALDAPLTPSVSQQPKDTSSYAQAMNRIIDAIQTKQFMKVNDLFDIEGLSIYNDIQKYGTARIVGEQNLNYFKGKDGSVTVRGMQVAFSFTSPKKVTFTEELVFTFNDENKICNISFGLGKVAEQDILCRNPKWDDAVKEYIMEFMENYKTAYCLKRLDYIRDIFADDAVIITGRVTHRNGSVTNIGEHQVTQFGRDIVTYNRQTKEQYLENLDKCFHNPRNKYINVKFAENDVQTLNSFDGHSVFGIQIKQLYNSATYGDVGYLFLMVDMTDTDKPQIKIRTWQPNETPLDELFHAGLFYD